MTTPEMGRLEANHVRARPQAQPAIIGLTANAMQGTATFASRRA